MQGDKRLLFLLIALLMGTSPTASAGNEWDFSVRVHSFSQDFWGGGGHVTVEVHNKSTNEDYYSAELGYVQSVCLLWWVTSPEGTTITSGQEVLYDIPNGDYEFVKLSIDPTGWGNITIRISVTDPNRSRTFDTYEKTFYRKR